jgi:hypothetical protein
MQTKQPPHIVPYYCHLTDRDGFAIIDETGCYTGEFYATYAAAVLDLINYITNKTR